MNRFLTALILLSVLTGCASHMAFDKETPKVDTTDKSIVLMVLDVYRPDDSRYVPVPYLLHIEKPIVKSKEDRLLFSMDKDADSLAEDGHTLFMIRLAVAPGEYKLMDVVGWANAFPFRGEFDVPLYLNWTVKPNSITYIGRVTATLRPLVGNEFRAGPWYPLIDQAVTKMWFSTWDITVDDMSKKDIALFRANYRAISNATIESVILPPFDRALAQRYWDDQPANEKPVNEKPEAATSQAISGEAAAVK